MQVHAVLNCNNVKTRTPLLVTGLALTKSAMGGLWDRHYGLADRYRLLSEV